MRIARRSCKTWRAYMPSARAAALGRLNFPNPWPEGGGPCGTCGLRADCVRGAGAHASQQRSQYVGNFVSRPTECAWEERIAQAFVIPAGQRIRQRFDAWGCLTAGGIEVDSADDVCRSTPQGRAYVVRLDQPYPPTRSICSSSSGSPLEQWPAARWSDRMMWRDGRCRSARLPVVPASRLTSPRERGRSGSPARGLWP